MALFRFHRDSLEESLKTTVIVNSFPELCAVISELASADANWAATVELEAYPSKENNFDKRIGWYTHIVRANTFEKDKLHPVGYLSEPLFVEDKV